MLIRKLRLGGVSLAMLFFSVGIVMFNGCDSGEKVIEKATGKQDVEQYQKMKKDIGKIADKQAERYNQIPDDDKK